VRTANAPASVARVEPGRASTLSFNDTLEIRIERLRGLKSHPRRGPLGLAPEAEAPRGRQSSAISRIFLLVASTVYVVAGRHSRPPARVETPPDVVETSGADVLRHLSSGGGLAEPTAVCPECGATVAVLGGGWLAVHRQGSSEYAYPRGHSQRCAGSLLSMPAPGGQ